MLALLKLNNNGGIIPITNKAFHEIVSIYMFPGLIFGGFLKTERWIVYFSG
jgi:hypothetical protein